MAHAPQIMGEASYTKKQIYEISVHVAIARTMHGFTRPILSIPSVAYFLDSN